VPFAVDNSLHCSGYSPLFRERDRDTPLFVASLWQTSRFRREPTTSVVSYRSDIAGCRRGVRGSGASSHHELNTLANGQYQYYFCAEYLDLKQSAMNPSSGSSKSSKRLHGRACLSSYVSLYITWDPLLSFAYSVCTPAQRSTHILNSRGAQWQP